MDNQRQPSAAARTFYEDYTEFHLLYELDADGLKTVDADAIVRMLDTYGRAQLERACQAVCDGCKQGRDAIEIRRDWFHPTINGDGKYYTPPMACKASAIRRLMDAPVEANTQADGNAPLALA